jgi:methenyltetrahydrofolate cyclohydrolase
MMKQILIIAVFVPFYVDAQSDTSNLWDNKVIDMISQTARSSPKFTGGCITLTNAGLATSLVVMSLEISKQKAHDTTAKKIIQASIDQLNLKIDSLKNAAYKDLHAFDDYLKAVKLPDTTKALMEIKRMAKHNALLRATISPLTASELINRILLVCSISISFCHYSVISDIGAGSGELRAATQAMLLLVKVNCMDLRNEEKRNFLARIKSSDSVANSLFLSVNSTIQKRIDQRK